MTAERPKRKPYRLDRAAGLAAAVGLAAYAGLIFVLCAGPPTLRAAAAGRVVIDWHSGLAIGGYDPVAFFTDSKATAGSTDFELRYGEAVWRFANVGNRAAFAARPDVYMPRYGGYDPLGVASGVAVAGNPNVWLIAGDRVFLFYDNGRRDKFAADPARAIAAADRGWPDLLRTLTP
jgi:hypothetical protein